MLRLHDSSVESPQQAPVQIERGIVPDGKPRCQFFIQIDSQTRSVTGSVVSIFQFRAAGEDVLFGLREIACFLYPEIRDCQVDVHIGRVTNR